MKARVVSSACYAGLVWFGFQGRGGLPGEVDRSRWWRLLETRAMGVGPRARGLVWLGVVMALAGVAGFGAPTYTELKRFGTLTNISGWNPAAPLVQAADGTLYGTTAAGEGTATGTVFRVSIDGSGFKVLKWFTNSWEGNTPLGGLVLSGNVLYGTVSAAGSGSSGGVFKLNTDGTGFGLVRQFSPTWRTGG